MEDERGVEAVVTKRRLDVARQVRAELAVPAPRDAVLRADGDRQDVTARSLDELHGLLRVGVERLVGDDLVFDTRDRLEFGLDEGVRVGALGLLDHRPAPLGVLRGRLVGGVDHDRGAEVEVDLSADRVEVGLVVGVQEHPDIVPGRARYQSDRGVRLGDVARDQPDPSVRASSYTAANSLSP